MITLNPPRTGRLAFPELVAITAAVMALNALAIDMMLPALSIIGRELDAGGPNRQQLIIGVYVMGNGVAQLFFGPIVDRFGRRKVMLLSLCAYLAGCLLSIVADNFALLLAARGFQGITTAATRVSVIAMVRDQCAGRQMARVMSVAITIFMAAPIVAPGFGQLLLFAGPWRGIFAALFLYGLVVGLWLYLRVPETLNEENRKPLHATSVIGAYGEFITNRTAIGYTLASAFCFGSLFAFVATSEQVFHDLFDLGDKFALAFAAVAGALGAATLTNARLVDRFGMRRLCHGALLVLIIANVMHLVIASVTGETLWVFLSFMCVSFFCLGLIGPNSSAIAMEPMGHIAGAAAAANGFAGTTVAGFIGTLIGQFYDGSTQPIVLGFCILATTAFGLLIWTEKGRLFHAIDRTAPVPAQEPAPTTGAIKQEDDFWLADGERDR